MLRVKNTCLNFEMKSRLLGRFGNESHVREEGVTSDSLTWRTKLSKSQSRASIDSAKIIFAFSFILLWTVDHESHINGKRTNGSLRYLFTQEESLTHFTLILIFGISYCMGVDGEGRWAKACLLVVISFSMNTSMDSWEQYNCSNLFYWNPVK